MKRPFVAVSASRALGAIAVAAVAQPALAERLPITIDGVFDDWQPSAIVFTDPAGDGGVGRDFLSLRIADDDRFLFLRLEVSAEFSLSESNNVTLYIDADNDAGTGLAVNGIGAELEWRFGARSGFIHAPGGATPISAPAIRFRAGPTVTSSTFEIAIGRDTTPLNGGPLFTSPVIRISLRDILGGDRLPNVGSTLEYTLDQGDLPPEELLPIERERPRDLRLVSYNVLFDSIFEPGLEPSFGRQLAAAAPDIIAFQEIYDGPHTAPATANLVSAWVTPPPGGFHGARLGDCITISRFPILGSWALDSNLASLIDATPVLGSRLLLINAHLPCCTNNAGRELEIDRIMAFIRDARTPGAGALDLAPEEPILIMGDMNLVGLSRQVTSLLTGDILDQSTFGPDFAPDWDGTPFTSVTPRQTDKRMGYTWRNDGGSFWPGHLDYIIYSDSVLESGSSFVLYTPEIPPARLTALGLQPADSLASDHLLFCADFRTPLPLAADFNRDGDVNATDLADTLASWGACDCPQDVNGDGVVNASDLALLLASWGPRPR